jgi:predicted RNA-binding Zn ribbon-like protein
LIVSPDFNGPTVFAMKPLFLGSHPAMDFLNTTLTPQGTRTELIGDGLSFVEWLVSAGLLDASTASKVKRRMGAKALDMVATEAKKMRAWAGEWISRWRDAAAGSYEAELRHLNGLLEGAKCHREVVQVNNSLQLAERCRIDGADELIALVAEQIALLITTEQPSLVKRCAGPACTLWFVDRTKAHRRLFCSAEACGNRAKVAAFRERQRAK